MRGREGREFFCCGISLLLSSRQYCLRKIITQLVINARPKHSSANSVWWRSGMIILSSQGEVQITGSIGRLAGYCHLLILLTYFPKL